MFSPCTRFGRSIPAGSQTTPAWPSIVHAWRLSPSLHLSKIPLILPRFAQVNGLWTSGRRNLLPAVSSSVKEGARSAPRTRHRSASFVGQTRLELVTPSLSEKCSNRLSYWPQKKQNGRKRECLERHPLRCGRRAGCAICGCQHIRSHGEINVMTVGSVPPCGVLDRCHAFSQKGGDPAAPSGTATLLRLHPPCQAYLRRRPP